MYLRARLILFSLHIMYKEKKMHFVDIEKLGTIAMKIQDEAMPI